jgi:hypothetical protein
MGDEVMTKYDFFRFILEVDYDNADHELDYWFIEATSFARKRGYVCANCLFFDDACSKCVKRETSTAEYSICKHFAKLD